MKLTFAPERDRASGLELVSVRRVGEDGSAQAHRQPQGSAAKPGF